MIRPGLCSVTFRSLDVPAIIELAAAAGLECIEWAGDVHVPAGDVAAAERARALTEQAGLAIASYGSYLRFVGSEEEVRDQGAAVLAAARALGAPRIRVWASRTASAEATAEERAVTVRRIQEFADAAAACGIDVGLEFHGGTLTDEIGSTRQLLAEIDRPAVRTYWQPHQGMATPEALATLQQVIAQTSTIHVFSWWPVHERLALSARSDLWEQAFALLAAEGSDRDALLEFVPEDDPALLARESDALRTLITAGEESVR